MKIITHTSFKINIKLFFDSQKKLLYKQTATHTGGGFDGGACFAEVEAFILITPVACISSNHRFGYHQHKVLYIIIAKGNTA